MLVLTLLVASVAGETQSSQTREQLLKYIVTSHKSNLESFKSGDFTFSVHHTPLAKDRRAAEATSKSPVAGKGMYAFECDNRIYSCEYDEKVLIESSEKVDEVRTNLPYLSRRMLSHKNSTLLDIITPNKEKNLVFHSAEIYDDRDFSNFQSRFDFPIEIGFPQSLDDQLGRDLHNVNNGLTKLTTIDERFRYNNSQVIMLKIDNPVMSSTYIIDPSKGCLVLNITEVDANGVERFATEFGELTSQDGCWYPQVKTVHNMIKQETKVTRVLTAVINKPVNEKKFTLNFNSPVGITDHVKNLEYTPRSTISLISPPTSKKESIP